jgi:hypothetical protein
VRKTGLMSALAAVKALPATETPSGMRGKKSNPLYMQISVLVEKEAYFEVKRRLVGRDMDASDLVNSLLQEWLKKDVRA